MNWHCNIMRSDAPTHGKIAKYLVGSIAVLVAAHGLGLWMPLQNVDDWSHISWSPTSGNLGRWALEYFFRHVLRNSFTHSFQAVGSSLLLLIVPFLLLTPEERALRSCLIVFCVGIVYPYWVDCLNFSSVVLAYPLALCLSLGAFHLAAQTQPDSPASASRLARRWFSSLLGGVLFCLALAVYQPLGTFGIIIPLLYGLRVEQVDSRRFASVLLRSALVGCLGAVLYIVTYEIYFAYASNPSSENVRAGYATWALFAEKLATIPQQTMDALRAVPINQQLPLYDWSQIAVGATLCAGWSMLIIDHVRRRRALAAARVLVCGPAALVAPVFAGWLIIKAGYPPRSQAAFAFGSIAILMVMAANLRSKSAPVIEWLQIRWRLAIGVVVSSAILTGTILSSKLWSNQWRASQRDIALATTIAATYAQSSPMLPPKANPLVIIGKRNYRDLWAFASVGRSAFDSYHATRAIFRELFRPDAIEVEWRPGPAAPLPCNRFPAPGSYYTYQGRVFFCLESSRGGPMDLRSRMDECAAPKSIEDISVCLDGDAVLYSAHTCKRSHQEKIFLHLYPTETSMVPAERRSWGFVNLDFRIEEYGYEESGRCYAGRLAPEGFEIARVRTGTIVTDDTRRSEVQLLPGVQP